MAQYEQRPGDGSLFKNDRKEQDKHPDYKGSMLCPVCSAALWLSSWIKRPSGKAPFMSISAQPKDKDAAPKTQATTEAASTYNPDECPF